VEQPAFPGQAGEALRVAGRPLGRLLRQPLRICSTEKGRCTAPTWVKYTDPDSLFEIELLIQPGDKRTDSRPGAGSCLLGIELKALPFSSMSASLALTEPISTPM